MNWIVVVIAVLVVIGALAAIHEYIRWERVVIREYQRAVKFVHGKYAGLCGPGVHVYRVYTSSVQIMDLRSQRSTVEGQEVLTQDGVGVRISLVAEYNIAEPLLALTRVQYPEQALYLAMQLALREVVTATSIDDLLSQRETIGAEVLRRAAPQAAEFGYTLSAVGVRDIMFPGALKRTMAAAVEARKEAEASLERARGEAATMRSLANTARMLEKNPALLQLRLLQALESGGENTLVLHLGTAPVGTASVDTTIIDA